jgi:hypothetical protein
MSTADKPDALPKRARNQCTKSSAQPEAARPVSTTEKRDTRFKPGNPGRPEGALNRSTMAALAIMEANAQKISEKACGPVMWRRSSRERRRPTSWP